VLISALQQQVDGVRGGEHVKFKSVKMFRETRQPASDQDAPASERAQQLVRLLEGLYRIHVVQDEKPARMQPQPVEHRREAHVFLRRVLLRQVQHQRAGEGGEVAAQRLRRVRDDEQQRRVLLLVRERVFHRGAGLADAAEAVERAAGDRGAAGAARQALVQVLQEGVAALDRLPSDG
jgi:hypothetical protein